MGELKFVHTKMQTRVLEIRLEREPEFLECFTTNITNDFWDDILSKDQAILVISGGVGTLKSALALKFCVALNPSFKVNQVGFCNTNILSIAEKSEEGDAFMRDEDPKEFGEGTGRVASQIIVLQEALRQRRNHLIFVAPIVRDVATAHYILETIDCTHDLEGIRKLKKGDCVYLRCGIKDAKTNIWMGYAIFKIPLYDKLWGEYQSIKEKWLNEVKSMEFGAEDYEAIAEKVAVDFVNKEDIDKYLKPNGSLHKGKIKSKLSGTLRNKYTAHEVKNIMNFVFDFLPTGN